ncbi:MAG: hypothetical protein AAB691_00480 [Patescibacteria group bacterium]
MAKVAAIKKIPKWEPREKGMWDRVVEVAMTPLNILALIVLLPVLARVSTFGGIASGEEID